MTDQSEIVVDKVLPDFLALIRDYYHITDAANYFLEGRTGESGINIAIANQRDVLSYLVTLLADGNLTEDERKSQLSNAEEHLRRAVVEPYQRAVEVMNMRYDELYKKYRDIALPLIERGAITNAPNLTAVRARLKRYRELYAEGRESKHRNLWDAKWNDGVKKFEEAFEIANSLVDELDRTISIAVTERRRKVDLWVKWSGWAFGLIGIVWVVASSI